MRAAVPSRIHSIAIRFILPLTGVLALVGSMAAATSPATSTAVPARFLLGVSATSASNAWAVGFIGGSPQQTLIQHWNGTAWKQVATPDPGPVGNILDGVSAVSASDAWAVGGAYAWPTAPPRSWCCTGTAGPGSRYRSRPARRAGRGKR